MFEILNEIISKFTRRHSEKQTNDRGNQQFNKLLQKIKIHFNLVTVMTKTPRNNEINSKDFIKVVYHNKPIWALFRCPCGCDNVISLSLQKIHNPYWKVIINPNGRPTLYPSVWQIKGCKSHFLVRDGRVIWCQNKGTKSENLERVKNPLLKNYGLK